MAGVTRATRGEARIDGDTELLGLTTAHRRCDMVLRKRDFTAVAKHTGGLSKSVQVINEASGCTVCRS